MRERRGRCAGGTALEFAVVASALIALTLLVLETGWQLAIGAALDYGARAASRFGITGAAAPPGMTPVPASRADALRAVVIQAAGGLLLDSRLTLNETSYASFGAIGTPQAGTPGAGTGGQIVEYNLSYTQPFLTGLAAAVTGSASVVHTASVIVVNEPFPAN